MNAAHNRTSWRFWLVGGGCIALLLLVDRRLWREAKLTRYVGRKEGVGSVVDEQFVGVFGSRIEQQRLEEKLRRAADVDTAGKAADALFKLLGEAGDSNGQREVMLRLTGRFPRERHATVIAAYKYLADYYTSRGERGELERVLRALQELARRKPPDGKLLVEVVSRACRAGLGKLAGETGGRALAMSSLAAGVRLNIATTLERFYRKAGDLAKAREMQVVQTRYRKDVNLLKLVRGETRLVDKLIRRKKWTEAKIRLLELAHDYPRMRRVLFATAAKLCEHYAVAGKYGVVREVWGAFKDMPAVAGGKSLVRGAGNFVACVIPALLGRGTALAETRDLLAWTGRVPGLQPELGYFLRGEVWARSGARGKPPKKLYLIRFKPDANVTLDGRMDERVYAGLEPLPGDYWLCAGGKTPLNKTPAYLKPTVKIFYTRDALVVGAFCPEPSPELLSGGPGPGPVESPWNYDCVEFYLEFERCLGEYQQWIVDANGGFRHLHIFGGYRHKIRRGQKQGEEKAPMRATGAVSDQGYGVEMLIPLSQLPVAAGKLHGRLMNGNFRRLRVVREGMKVPPPYKGGKLLTVSWARLGYNHHTEKFDFIRFE